MAKTITLYGGRWQAMLQPESPTEFQRLLEQVQAGSETAAWELVSRYGSHVQRFVRRALHQRLRSKFDSLDFVQIVWASLFRAPEKLRGMHEPEEFIGFLATMAKFKVLTEVRKRFHTAKHNLNCEVSLESYDMEQGRSIPTPSAVAVAKERWESMLCSQSDHVRQIVTLRLKGEKFVDIAKQLGIHERTARKAIERLTSHAEE